MLGTALSPYLYIWQPAEEVDNLRAAGESAAETGRPVSGRHLRSARIDTFIGMFLSQLVPYCIILTTATVLHAHGRTGALAPLVGPVAFLVFAIGFIGAGILSIPVLSASAAYAINEVAGIPGSLAGRPRYQPTFYAVVVLVTAAGVAMTIVHVNVIQALVIASALSGVAAVPLLVLMTLFGADSRYMSKRRSGRLSQALTWIAAAGMAAACLALLGSFVLR